jgi:hypothetical protein
MLGSVADMSLGRPRPLLLAAALLSLLVAPPAQAEPGEELTIYALTFGPGDHPFFKFGHNALWVQPRDGQGLVYNFGTFGFDQPNLIPKFLKGRLMYWLSVSPVDSALESYRATNRTIEAQELDLTPAERLGLFQRLQENSKLENREYLYDYFWDNCSTRVRDAIDVTLGGKVKVAGQAPAAMTLRAHALRLTADLLWEYVGLHFGLGQPTDRPLNAWNEAFLPEKLRDLLRTVKVEREGGARPLVKSERVLFMATRPTPLAQAPRWAPWFALVGVAVGGTLALVGLVARGQPAARVLLGLLSSVLGLVLGLLGLILVALWLFTNHKATHANANILLCAPWAVALAPLGIGVAQGWSGSLRTAYALAVGAAVLAVVGVVAKVLPGLTQDNTAFLVLLVPIWLGMAFGLRQVVPGRP